MKILWSSNASVFNKLYWNIAIGYSCFYTVKAKLFVTETIRHLKLWQGRLDICRKSVLSLGCWLCFLSPNLYHQLSPTDSFISNASVILSLLLLPANTLVFLSRTPAVTPEGSLSFQTLYWFTHLCLQRARLAENRSWSPKPPGSNPTLSQPHALCAALGRSFQHGLLLFIYKMSLKQHLSIL